MGPVVWFPTFDAENQVRDSHETRPFVSVSRSGQLLPEVKEVIALAAKNNLVRGDRALIGGRGIDDRPRGAQARRGAHRGDACDAGAGADERGADARSRRARARISSSSTMACWARIKPRRAIMPTPSARSAPRHAFWRAIWVRWEIRCIPTASSRSSWRCARKGSHRPISTGCRRRIRRGRWGCREPCPSPRSSLG